MEEIVVDRAVCRPVWCILGAHEVHRNADGSVSVVRVKDRENNPYQQERVTIEPGKINLVLAAIQAVLAEPK